MKRTILTQSIFEKAMVTWIYSSFLWKLLFYSNISNFNIAQAERFASGVPKKQFARIANKEVKHKL